MAKTKPDYGVDAPNVLWGLFLGGAACLIVSAFLPGVLRFGPPGVTFEISSVSFRWIGGCLLLESALYLFYVKVGKLAHRDRMLAYHAWRGDERVLDVGCGRGLLLIGAAKRLGRDQGHDQGQAQGQAIGIDIWSTQDMAGNSLQATQKNIDMEGVSAQCELLSIPAQEMTFADASFDVVVSNLCLHNIYDKRLRKQALLQIVRVLKPGGQAILSDYKLTGEYARILKEAGCEVTLRWGSPLTTFPPLRTVIAVRV